MSLANFLKKTTKNEVPESKHIPILRHVNDNILKTVNGDYFFTLKISGLAYETIDDVDLDIKAESRNMTISAFDGKPVCFYSHTIRRKIKVDVKKSKQEGFLKILDNVYNKKFNNNSYYINELYLTVLYRNTDGIINKYSKKENIEIKEETIVNEIEDYIINLKGAFYEYGVKLLGIREENNKLFSEPMEFLSKIINVDDFKMMLPEGKIRNYLAVNRKIFGWRNLEVICSTQSKFGAMISIKNYCADTHSGMLDHLSSLNCEFVITQTFKVQNRQGSIEHINTIKRQMDNGDHATGLAGELDSATNQISSNEITMGENHFTFFLYAEDLKKLNDVIGLAQAELTNIGIISVIDKLNTEAGFWSQIPGNTAYIARKGVISSFNYSHFSSFHNLPIGKEDNNKWGDYITTITTANDTPYFYNWHYKDVGLTTIIGPAGSGKTVVTLLLLAQSMKVNPSVFIFDKDRGAEIFIRAAGGDYSNIKLGERTKWNPLAIDLEKKFNREFVFKFMKALLRDNKEINAQESAKINDLVNVIQKTPVEKRVLRNFQPLIQSTLPERIYSFKRWITDKTGRKGEYYWCFDNDKDYLDIGTKGIMGFDTTDFLDIPEIRTPILMYLFKRIENALDGSPTIIFVDECQKATEDETFRKEFENHANTIRKRNGMIVMATQQAKKMNVNSALVEQSQNQIFFANPKATKEDYKTFALSTRELQIVQKLPQKQGWFLLKRPDGCVIVRADLSGCDDELAVLSARDETLKLMDLLIKEHSREPKKWLPKFYQQWRDYEKENN